MRPHKSAGVQLIWLLDPTTRSVLVYRGPTTLYEVPDTAYLDGEDVLPGFRMLVAAIFEL
jgi:Uma2 family endonuclease